MFIQKQAVPLAHTDLHFAAQKWKTLQKIRTYIFLYYTIVHVFLHYWIYRIYVFLYTLKKKFIV